MKQYINYSTEVKAAIAANKPIVALESTIISHGMPYPDNVKTAKKCEEIVRSYGAVPATIAILDGKFCVGLEEQQLQYLGQAGTTIKKTSRRDLAYFLEQKIDGATTVAATMYIASLASIDIFATGGIGGVHRNAEKTFDISADLDELAQTDVCVVCAGAKAILDLGKTLEYLETKGVPVVGYKTKILPAFYTKDSTFDVPITLHTPKEIARVFSRSKQLGLNAGMLVTNPIPSEFSMDYETMETVINQAVNEAEKNGITGKETTPYLLAKIVELTDGSSLQSNIQLVYNNCALAAQIATAYNQTKED